MPVYFLIFLTILLLVFLFSMVWPPDSPWSPWWRTNKKVARLEAKLAKINKNDVIYDLGCGEGKALITAAKLYGARGVGVEIDPIRAISAKISTQLAGVSKKVTIIRKNFFEVDVSEATVIYVYLIPKALNKLKIKFLRECKPGTKIVSFVYQIDLPMIASDEENEIYVYKMPGKH